MVLLFKKADSKNVKYIFFYIQQLILPSLDGNTLRNKKPRTLRKTNAIKYVAPVRIVVHCHKEEKKQSNKYDGLG